MPPQDRLAWNVVLFSTAVIVTLFFAPWAVAFIWFALERPPVDLARLAWGISGTAGVLGFWTWAFLKHPLSRCARALVTASLLLGVIAIGAFLLMFVLRAPWGLLTPPGLVAAAGIGCAVVAYLKMWSRWSSHPSPSGAADGEQA